MGARDHFDLTPQQYHAGLDKLWSALRLTTVQDEDVFTLAAQRIAELEAECVRKADRIADQQTIIERHEQQCTCVKPSYESSPGCPVHRPTA